MLQSCSPKTQHVCRRVVEDSLELYTCKPGSGDSETPASITNGTAPGSYNELATLMTVTGTCLPTPRLTLPYSLHQLCLCEKDWREREQQQEAGSR